MSIDSSPTSVEGLLAAAQGKDSGELKALVARIVIDSLGRPWDPLKHPRDAEGKFIETFAEVRGLFRTRGGAKGAPQVSGRVVAFDRNGDVFVRIDNVAEGYTAHKPGDLVAIKTDDLQALDAKAKINRPIDENQRAQLKAVAARVRAVDADAADALERAADPANTETVAQLADLREARDLLDDNEDEAASPAARDLVWDLLDQVGDQPTNDEVLRAAKHLIRDDMVKRGADQKEIARLDADIEAPAPSAREGAPDPVDVFAAQLYRRADQLKDRVPADANALKAVADALGDAAQSGMGPEDRAAKLRAAQVRALPIKNAGLKKQVNDRIKALLANPKAPAAPVPERKAEVAPPPPAQPLTPEAPGRSVDAVPAAPQVEGDAPAPDQAEEIGKVPGNLTGRTSPGVAKAIADALPDAPDDWPRDAKSLWKETQDEFRAISEMPDGPEADDAFLSAVTDAEELLRGSRVEADPAQAQNPDDAAGWADLVDKLDGALAEHRDVWDGLISRPRPVPPREPAQPVAEVPEPQSPEIPDGWVPVEKDPGFLNQPDGWSKDGYEVDAVDGGLRVMGDVRNGVPAWQRTVKDWSEVEALIAEREAGGIPQAERADAVAALRKMGFGDDALDVVQYGSYAEIEDALRADPRWAELETGYRDAMDADGWRAKDKKAFQDWNDLQAGPLLRLKAARNVAPAAGGDGPSEPPAAPEVPAYSGELRPVQPRDVEEMLRAVDNAKNWLSESNVDFMYDDQVGAVQDASDKQRLADDWARVEDGLRRKDYGAAQAALGDIEDALGNPNVDPEFLDNQKPFVEQVRGVLDKVVQRDRGQFEIPGAAPASPDARIEQAAPELNAAFDAEMQDNPEINTNMRKLVDALTEMRNAFREYNEPDFEVDGVQRAIDAFNRADYFAGFDLADAAVRGKAAGDYVAGFDAKDALERAKIDWQNMLDGNPDLARYLPGARSEAPAVDIPGDEPLAEWEKVLLDGIDADERDAAKAAIDKASAPDESAVLEDEQNRAMAWRQVIADMDGELPDMGELYNEYVQDGQGNADEIKDAVGRIREKFERDEDKVAVDVLDDILYRNGVTRDAGAPEPSPELMIPDAPGDGSPVKDERRILQPRVRGEIEAVARGIGLPELPDRIDLDRNGVVVAPLDLVDVPAAGNQGPQNALRRPAGIGQIRRIYTKGGVRYAEVAFYDPKFVDYPHKNAAKARGELKNNEPFYRWDGIRLDKVQKVDDSNPDAQEFLSHLGPEEQRQYAGRNAGRLAQQRGRVRAEMERMANLRYIADRYAPDADGLLVGKGDVVVYKGKKYEVARVDNDDPGVGNNKRLDLVPLGIDGAPELQAGGKHANPYARMVRFYDQPLGDAQPAVTVDELKDMVKRLDGGGRYVVGDAVRAALEGDDLKEVARAFNEDDAIRQYIADGRAYIQDYVNRLLQANVRGNYDEVKRNEPEMVRKDKNDLLNAMAAVEGRFLVGEGRDRHIRREIPEAGPDAGYQGNRPEVLLPLRYKDALGRIDRKIEADPGNPMWGAAKEIIQEQGVKNLDDDGQFDSARELLRYLAEAVKNGGGADVGDAVDALIAQMDAWHDEQLKRRAIVQGGPGGLNPLPFGRTVAPGLVRDPRLSEASVPDPGEADWAQPEKAQAIIDWLRADGPRAIANSWLGRDRDFDAKFARVLDAWERGGINGIPNEDRRFFADLIGALGYDALVRNQGVIDAFPDRADDRAREGILDEIYQFVSDDRWQRGRPNFPRRRVGPAAPDPARAQNAKDEAFFNAAMADDAGMGTRYRNLRNEIQKVRDDVIAAGGAQDLADYLTKVLGAMVDGKYGQAFNDIERILAVPVDDPDAEQLGAFQDHLAANGWDVKLRRKHGVVVKDYENVAVPDARGQFPARRVERINPPAAPAPPAERRLDPTEGRNGIAAAIEARYEELRADRKNNEARRAANLLEEIGDDLDAALKRAMDADRRQSPEERSQALRDALGMVPEIGASNPELAQKIEQDIKAMEAHFLHEERVRLIERYFDEADAAHNADTPDTAQRDRLLRAAEDLGKMLAQGDPAYAAQVAQRIEELQARYDEEDRNRALARPRGRTEALESFDEKVQQARKHLRDGGQAAQARDLVGKADDVADALNDAEDAHRAGNKEERDGALDRARVAIDNLDQADPGLAEAARAMIEGNAARYARDDSRGDLPGTTPLGPEGAKLKQRIEELTDHLSLTDLQAAFTNNPFSVEAMLPDGWKWDKRWQGGSLNAPRRLITPEGKFVYIKRETSEQGAIAEETYGRVLNMMGFPGVAYVKRNGRVLAGGAVGGDGIEDRGEFAEAFANKPSEDGYLNHYRAWVIKKVGLADLKLADEDSAVRIAVLNAVFGNTDRHHGNVKYGWVANPNEPGGGHGVLLPIDHGFMLFNNFGSAAEDIKGTPLEAFTGKAGQGNPNQFLRAFVDRVRKDRTSAEQVYERALDDLERGLYQLGLDPKLERAIKERIEWMRKNRSAFIRGVENSYTRF